MKQVLIFFIFAVIIPAHAASVSIRADEWFPMNGQPESNAEGYMIDLAREVFSQAGHTVDYKQMPWERALKEVREGNFDCVVGAYHEDAPDFIFPNENWGMDKTGYYTSQKSTWTFNGLDSLLDQKVGIIKGYAYEEEFNELIKSNPKVFDGASGNDALDKNFKKLAGGRIDVVVESISVGNAKIKELGFKDKVKLSGENPTAEPLYIACSPNNPASKQYVELIDNGTKTLRASGKLKEILGKYGLEDWK